MGKLIKERDVWRVFVNTLIGTANGYLKSLRLIKEEKNFTISELSLDVKVPYNTLRKYLKTGSNISESNFDKVRKYVDKNAHLYKDKIEEIFNKEGVEIEVKEVDNE